jgi:hypothetical protein
VYKNRKLAWLIAFAMVFTIVAPLGVNTAVAQGKDMSDLVAELNKVYPYIDEGEKSDIRTARSNLQKLTDEQWTSVLNPLLTDQVKGELGDDAQETLKQVALDAAEINYAADAGQLESNLNAFKENNKNTFKLLFGDDTTMTEMADFLIAAKGNLKIAAIGEAKTILEGSNQVLAAAMPSIVEDAVQKTIEQSEFNDFRGNLNKIGWSTNLLVEQHNVLVGIVDPGQEAELALAKAWVRSEAKVKKGDIELTPTGTFYSDKIKVGDKVSYGLSIIDWPATALVKFDTMNSNVITAKTDEGQINVQAVGPGDGQLIFYRGGEGCTPKSDWIAKVNITVPSSGGSGGGGGGGPVPFGGTKITADQGGKLSGHGATVEIPGKAFEKDFRVKIEKATYVAGMPLPQGGKLASEVVDITKNEKGDFTKPVTITMTFDKSKVDDQAEIGLYWYDSSSKTWNLLDNIEVDMDKAAVSGETKHFTKFAVIAATPVEEVPPTPVVLTDIAGHWAEASIKALVDKGAIAGYPDQTFKPNRTITRAEFAKVLVKAFELEAKDGKVFEDTASHWAKDDIATANAHGIIKGYSDQKFGPNDLITREQVAVMVTRATNLTASDQAPVFTDSAEISDWAKEAVASAAEAGIINGYPDGSFQPQGNATRAEAATIIMRAIK